MAMISFLMLIVQLGYSETSVLSDTIVSAARTEKSVRCIGKCMTVITREDIEKDGATTVFEILRNYPGLHFVQEGPFGGVTEVRLRGTKPGHTLVLIDGVKVNDPSSPDRSFDWGTLPTVAVERIEVVRGPQGALYGSDALGGVINIITKTGNKGFKAEGSVSYGSYRTLEEWGGVSGGTDYLGYSISLFNTNSAGMSKALAKEGESAPEIDGFTNRGVYGKLNVQLLHNLTTDLAFGMRSAVVDMDDGQFRDDPDAQSSSDFEYGNLSLGHRATESWSHKLTVGWHRTGKQYEDEADEADTTGRSDSYDGESVRGGWQTDFTLHRNLGIVAGVDYTKESAESWCGCAGSGNVSRVLATSLTDRSLYAEINPRYNDLSLILNGRIDSYSDHGNQKTWQASLVWPVNCTRFKGSYGTGFKMPTIYQFFNTKHGNSELKPETIVGYDVSGEHEFESGLVEVVYFNKRIKKLIVLDESRYVNRKHRWYSEGLELNVLLQVSRDFRMDIQYTGVEKVKFEEDYLQVPSHNYRWAINYRWLNIKFCCIGKRYDEDHSGWSEGLIDLKSCRKIDLTTSFRFRAIKLQARIENLINEDYMEEYGYGTPGRSFYVGISI
jgi:vitamin B12 transporter